MKKRVIAVVLSLVLTMSMSFTALAASSSSDSNSGDQSGSSSSSTSAPASSVATPSNPKPVAAVVNETKAGEEIPTAAIQVAVASPNGTATAVTLDVVVEEKQVAVVQAVAQIATITATVSPTASAVEQQAAAAQVVQKVSELLTQAPSPQFQETVKALATMKGADVAVNNMGTVKTAAVAKDALGNTIASAGKIQHVTAGALVMLMSVNADGTIEYVEGVVDPVTGEILGAFQGTPAVITVMVLA